MEFGERWEAQYPERGWEFMQALSHAKLVEPDNSKNIFYGYVRWAIDGSPDATSTVHMNFPGERLKNGQGYVGQTFEYDTDNPDGTITRNECKIIHGIGSVGLIVPLSAGLTETITDGLNPIAEPLWRPQSLEDAAVVLEKFGISE